MSWRDRIQTGTFRGVPFFVEEHGAGGGRRLALHEYPGRDEPYTEDLGRRGREFDLDCYVLGDDYMVARDSLIEALEAEGPGNLVHPWLGTRRVAVRNYRLRESTRQGGIAWFNISFVEAGELIYPAASRDTAAEVVAAADAANAAAIDDYAETFSVDGLPEGFLTEIETELGRTLADLERTVGSVTKTIAAEIRAPYNMATLIVGSIASISAVATEPLRAINLYEGLFNAGSSSPSVPTSTADRKQQATNNQAMHTLTQRAAIVEACRASSQAQYAARDDALAVRERLFEAIDAQVEAVDINGRPVSDAMYQALIHLRTKVAEDLQVRGAQLPSLATYMPVTTLPALVLAHDIYGDASRESELVDRNKIRHPGFVPGGEELEVLRG